MKQIKLTQGKFALVDDEDFERLNQWKWCANKSKNGNRFYAIRKIKINGKQITQQMHSLIMGDNSLKLDVDHIDGNGCNDQRSNLRFCTISQNAMNQSKRSGCTSTYKGVHWNRFINKWGAKISKDYKAIHQKCFSTEIEAAKQYDTWAIELFGEFAKLNFKN